MKKITHQIQGRFASSTMDFSSYTQAIMSQINDTIVLCETNENIISKQDIAFHKAISRMITKSSNQKLPNQLTQTVKSRQLLGSLRNNQSNNIQGFDINAKEFNNMKQSNLATSQFINQQRPKSGTLMHYSRKQNPTAKVEFHVKRPHYMAISQAQQRLIESMQQPADKLRLSELRFSKNLNSLQNLAVLRPKSANIDFSKDTTTK